MTDEMRIQFALDEFYETMKTFDGSNEKLEKICLMRNNIINITDTYLKKFNNPGIMTDFYTRLKKAKHNAIKGTLINKYTQYMNEMRVIQEFKGIRENISDKLAEQLFNQWRMFQPKTKEVKFNAGVQPADGSN